MISVEIAAVFRFRLGIDAWIKLGGDLHLAYFLPVF